MTITGIDAVTFGVTDLETAARFASDWGLHDEGGGCWSTRDGSQVWLRGRDDAGLPPAIEIGSTLRRVTWGVDTSDALGVIADELARDRHVDTDEDGTVHSTDDAGLAVAFRVSSRRPVAVETFEYEANVPGVARRVDRGAPFYERAEPHEISHVVIGAPDLAVVERFYVERLGFLVSDRYRGRAVFLRGAPAGNHHHLFLLNSADAAVHFNHICFKVRNVHEVIGGGQHIVAAGWPSQAGPGRHYVSSGCFWYFESPWGGAAEYAADEDVVSAAWEPREFEMSPEIFTEWRFNLAGPTTSSMPLAASTVR